MDVKSIDNDKFLVSLNPTESRMLHEVAFGGKQEVEKVLASMLFFQIGSASAELKLAEAIASHDEYWDR